MCYGKQDYPFNYSEFICDNNSDIATLPTNQNSSDGMNCAFGSSATCINGDKYILMKNGWVKFGSSSGENNNNG